MLTDVYWAKAAALATERVALGSVRLAALFNAALVPSVDPRLGCNQAGLLPVADLG